MHRGSPLGLLVSVAARRGPSFIRPDNTMRVNFGSALTCFSMVYTSSMSTTTTAWSLAVGPARRGLTSQTRSFSLTRSASALTTDDKLVSEEPVNQAPKPLGKPIAEGAILSYYRGGLSAVQIRDEIAHAGGGPKTSSDQGDEILGHQVMLPSGAVGVVVAYRPPIAFIYSDNKDEPANMDGVAKILDSLATVSVSEGTQLVDCFGRPLDELVVEMDGADGTPERPIFAPIPQIKDISLINSPMLSGVTMIDAMAPIGKGQNMLVVGHDLPMMRGFVRDLLSTQVRLGTVKCVCAITQNHDVILEELREANLLGNVIVVSSRCDDDADVATRAAEATLVAATACAIAESLALSQGQETLVVVDSIDQHKELWGATTRTLLDVFGVDAVVQADREGGASSEMRAFYSSLIQRAAQFNKKNGGGSVTLTLLTSIPSSNDETYTVFVERDFEHAGDKIRERVKLLTEKKIPLTAENLRKIDIPIPSVSEGQRRLALQHVDDLISMSDGQIWLDEQLASAGQRPPMDPQKSITRVGIGADTASRADAPALRRIVEGIRLEIAQAASMDGAEETDASRRQTRRRNAWLLAMHQEPGQGGRSLSESCVVLLAASTRALDKTLDAGGSAGTKTGQDFIGRLLEYVWATSSEAMEEIDESFDLSTSTRAKIVGAIESFTSSS